MKLTQYLLGISLGFGMAGTAVADTVVLKFENIIPAGQTFSSIGDYYNGAGGSANNFGVSFSSNALALCLNTLSNPRCSGTSRGGLGDPTSQEGGLVFVTGSETFMNDSAGFTDGFSLFYTAVNNPGSLSVYSGLNGTGTLLATIDLPITSSGCPGYVGFFCPFVPVGVSFSGTAQSISFAGVADQIVFDDVTFGSEIPGGNPVPEPSTLVMMLTGAGAAVTQLRRRMLASHA